MCSAGRQSKWASRPRRRFAPFLILALLLAIAPAGHAAYQRPGTIELVSARKVNGKLCTGSSTRQTLLGGYKVSDNGRYVAFASSYCDLVPGDDNQAPDVFRYDRLTRKIELVSVSSLGTMAVYPPGPTPGSFQPSISADGRYVSFDSDAVNLVSGHVNATRHDVYVRDMKVGRTELISVPLSGKVPDPLGQSKFSSISANGGRVAFESTSRDLWDDAPNPNNDQAWKIFVYDRGDETMTLASVDSEGNRPSQGTPLTNSMRPSISGNGRVVMFMSDAMDLVDDDTSIWNDVFVHELSTGRTERVSVATGGRQANSGTVGTGSSEEGSISHDGRVVVFASGLQDYVPNDTFKYPRDTLTAPGDVFVHDRRTGRTERISVNSSGEEVSEGSGSPVISPDGRYVSFRGVSDLGGGRPPSYPEFESDIFLHDRLMGTVERVAVSNAREHSDCQEGNGPNHPGGISRGGRFVSFLSCATNLVSSGRHEGGAFGDNAGDVYLRDRGTPLGVGGLPGTERKPPDDDDDFLICLTDDICIPDPTAHIATAASSAGPSLPSGKDIPGADLIGASAAYRRNLGDLLLRADVESMAPLASPALEGAPILYGFDLRAAGNRYQVRVQVGGSDATRSLQPISFGLFRKDTGGYVRVTGLRGGYGTTGDQVVVALPLAHLGLQDGGAIGHLRAFTALGTYDLGAVRILDRILLR